MANPDQIDRRYMRYSQYNRLRHGEDMKAFLAEQATRLSMTEEQIFELLKSNTADEIRAMTP